MHFCGKSPKIGCEWLAVLMLRTETTEHISGPWPSPRRVSLTNTHQAAAAELAYQLFSFSSLPRLVTSQLIPEYRTKIYPVRNVPGYRMALPDT